MCEGRGVVVSYDNGVTCVVSKWHVLVQKYRGRFASYRAIPAVS